MKIHHVLIFCFLSGSCGGSTGLVHARMSIFTGPKGGNGTVQCPLSSAGSWKFFCKDECREKGILLKTADVRARNGRYSLKYKRESSGTMFLTVTITKLIPSDTGRYRFGVGPSSGPNSSCDFEARVSDELLDKNAGFIWTNTEGENFTYPCMYGENRGRFFLCRDDCKKEEEVLIETDQKKAQSGRYSIEYVDGSAYGLHVTITQMKTSDTGRYKCGYGRALSPDSFRKITVIVIEAPSSSTPTPTPPQSLISSTAASVFSNTTGQLTVLSHGPHSDYTVPVVVGLGVLLLVLLLLFMRKTMKKHQNVELSTIQENQALDQKCEDSL
ncbi:hypothetical protein Q5P01_007123 [Channa striata]|uniref:Uncharacterized protein n=1 Tax=Channa striata TaxID=64152 RepID=A0AA88N8S3_CHASR|nr:hypothetical protein Q5P01_007123 [Channa striata]